MTDPEKRAYIAGYKHALWLWAWWKDGEQMVGTCGTTYKEALAEVDAERDGFLRQAEHCLSQETP